jgi:hypothetical protein
MIPLSADVSPAAVTARRAALGSHAFKPETARPVDATGRPAYAGPAGTTRPTPYPGRPEGADEDYLNCTELAYPGALTPNLKAVFDVNV